MAADFLNKQQYTYYFLVPGPMNPAIRKVDTVTGCVQVGAKRPPGKKRSS
jgi:hypothetical protein